MPVHITPQCNMAEVFKALSENGWKFYPSLKSKFIEQFFCETPTSNTNSLFLFCFFLCNKVSGSLCYIVSLWEQETLYHRKVLQLKSTVLNQGTLGGFCSISQPESINSTTTWYKGEGCQKHLGLVFYFELIFCHFMSRNLCYQFFPNLVSHIYMWPQHSLRSSIKYLSVTCFHSMSHSIQQHMSGCSPGLHTTHQVTSPPPQAQLASPLW